jgi:type VI secretion system secreted protein Hcp
LRRAAVTQKWDSQMGNMFLKLTKIHGESRDHVHKHEIEIYDWTWHISNQAPFRLQDSEATRQTKVEHITIDKIVDKATTALTSHCAFGRHIPEGILTFRKNDGDSQVEYLQIILTDVKVEKVAWDVKGEHGIKETVDLSFLKFKINYYAQKNEGQLGGVHEVEFDVPEHKGQQAPAKK